MLFVKFVNLKTYLFWSQSSAAGVHREWIGLLFSVTTDNCPHRFPKLQNIACTAQTPIWRLCKFVFFHYIALKCNIISYLLFWYDWWKVFVPLISKKSCHQKSLVYIGGNVCTVESDPGLILGLRPANGWRRYVVTTSLIAWAQVFNQPCDRFPDTDF